MQGGLEAFQRMAKLLRELEGEIDEEAAVKLNSHVFVQPLRVGVEASCVRCGPPKRVQQLPLLRLSCTPTAVNE